jgi:redox-sensitive bicupin YhaK (pirin superfamily)
MQTVIHINNERGTSDLGWLKTYFSFSFADWYNPERMGFGALRVLNDDVIAPHTGFPKHHHSNFEIITIVTKGVISHEDSLGNTKEVREGEVQVMSAGTGVLHSEWNKDKETLELFQIWIETNKEGIVPRYDQKSFLEKDRKNKWQLLVSEHGGPAPLCIYQNAKILRSSLEKNKILTYTFSKKGMGAYLFVMEGKVNVGDISLGKRDAVGVWDTKDIRISAEVPSEILLIEVPHT